MAKIYYVNDSGSRRIPITDGTYSTFDMPGSEINYDTESGVFVIAFYDSSGSAVTPTGGTITPEMSPIQGQWQAPGAGDASIDATTVIAGTASYTIPLFDGPAIEGRMTLSGITGADHCVAFFWRTN